MAKNDNIIDFLGDVADAIREKKGTAEPIAAQDFSSEIASIKTAGMRYFDVRGFDTSNNPVTNSKYGGDVPEWNIVDMATTYVKEYDGKWFIYPRYNGFMFYQNLAAIGVSLNKWITAEGEYDNAIEFIKDQFPNYDFEARFPEITEEEFYDLTWEAPEEPVG